MNNSRAFWQDPRAACISALVLVFLCGAVVGALAFNMGVHRYFHRAAFWTDAGKTAYLDRIKKELDLSPTQTSQMESILDDFAKYYVTVLSDGKSRILQILNDEQKRKFEKLLEESKRP
jgi:hypothetical protein